MGKNGIWAVTGIEGYPEFNNIWAVTGIEVYPEFNNKIKEDFVLRLILKGGHYCKIDFLAQFFAVNTWVRLIEK